MIAAAAAARIDSFKGGRGKVCTSACLIDCFITCGVGDVPRLKRAKESEFIHLKGRIWTKPSAVMDEGRYGVVVGVEGQKHSRSQDNTQRNNDESEPCALFP